MKAKAARFGIPAEDVDRARKFYNEAFGGDIVPVPQVDYSIVWTAVTDDKWMLKELGATTGALAGSQPFTRWKSSGVTGKGAGGPYHLPKSLQEQSRTVCK